MEKENLDKLSTKELMSLLYQKVQKENLIEQGAKQDNKDIEEVLKKENLYTEYLEGFDDEFETNTQERIKETPLLMNLFIDFVQEIYRPSKLYKIATEAKKRIDKDLIETLNERQQFLYKQFKVCDDRILDDMVEQAFIYGYSMASQLREEAIKQYPLSNNISLEGNNKNGN